MKKLFTLILSAALLSCTAIVAQAANAHATEATVLRVQGSATVVLPGETESVPLTIGMKLPTGATITTGAGGEVDIQPFTGSMTSVKSNTTVDLEELSVNKGRSGVITRQTAKLNLRSGNLISTLDPARKSINNYSIRTPRGVAAARGTVYTVTVNAGGSSSVATLTGTVTLTPVGGGPPIIINIGTGMIMNPDGSSTGATLASLVAAEATSGNTGEGSMTEAISQAVTTVAAAVKSGAVSTVAGNSTSATSVLAAVVNVAAKANPSQASTFANQAVTAVTASTSGMSSTEAANAASTLTEAAVQGAVATTVANGGDASAVSTMTNAIASSAVMAATASGTTDTTGIVRAAAKGAVTSTVGTSVDAPTTITTGQTTTDVSATSTTTTSSPITPIDVTVVSPSSASNNRTQN